MPSLSNDNYNTNSSNLNGNQQLPRYFTPEGQNNISKMRNSVNTRITPTETHVSACLIGFNVIVCGGITNSYNSRGHGGSPS